jgi:hypothetical protein
MIILMNDGHRAMLYLLWLSDNAIDRWLSSLSSCWLGLNVLINQLIFYV